MANVKVEKNRYTVDTLYQWDLNQVLEIYGLSLPAIPEIHFTNDVMVRAVRRFATMDAAGVIRAEVPNAMLQTSAKIKALVCIREGEVFKTYHEILIPVKARQKPADYTITDEDDIYSFLALENLVYDSVAEMKASNAAASASAKQAIDTATNAQNVANAAAATANSIAQTAEDAKTTAEDAKTIAEGALPKTGGKLTGAIEMDGQKITGLPEPENDSDAATKKTIFDALADLPDGLSMELLWENASLASEFAEQTIPLDLSGYDLFIIEAVYSNSVTNVRACSLAIGYVAVSLTLNTFADAPNLYVRERRVELSENGAYFKNCYNHQFSGATYETLNGYTVPSRIFGIKGVSA